MAARAKKAAAPRKKANGYKMPVPIAEGEVIHDTLMKKKWRIGPSIGVGGFGEIYSACDHEIATNKSDYPFVIKIEPHENGPLFVEKHFYIRNTNKNDIAKFMKDNKLPSLGMPSYYGNGCHDYNGEKLRYLVLERYGKDLWSLFLENGRKFPSPTVFVIGLQMLDVLQYIHSRGYVHADLKGANILLGLKKGTENQAYLVDYGLATRVNDKEFKPDPKCAHNGTIEYTSRDAHLGVATMRGDLEILGYNMLQWIVGTLPWEQHLKVPKTVQEMKEGFMKNPKGSIAKMGDVPDALIKFFEYINKLQPKDVPDYTACRHIFEGYLKSEGKSRSSKLEFKKMKSTTSKTNGDSSQPKKRVKKTDDAKVKRGRPRKIKDSETENSENETPNNSINKKRRSKTPSETQNHVVKRVKLTPKSTPPVKKNHANIATQTSGGKPKRSPRQVSFDSPISEVIGDSTQNESSDIFDESFTLDKKKVKKRKLLSKKELTVSRIVKNKIVKVVPKGKSWKDMASIVNGRSPPKS